MADKKYEQVPLTPFMESLGFTEPVEVDMESIRAEARIAKRIGVREWPVGDPPPWITKGALP